jgi:hypothetical protein
MTGRILPAMPKDRIPYRSHIDSVRPQMISGRPALASGMVIVANAQTFLHIPLSLINRPKEEESKFSRIGQHLEHDPLYLRILPGYCLHSSWYTPWSRGKVNIVNDAPNRRIPLPYWCQGPLQITWYKRKKKKQKGEGVSNPTKDEVMGTLPETQAQTTQGKGELIEGHVVVSGKNW